MDPDQTLIDLLEQLADGDGSGAVGCCESLAEWLDAGGAVPQAMAQRALQAMKTCEAPACDDALAKIAKEELGIETLETRNSDRLDFHDVGVWGIHKALRLAWTRGYEDATRAACERADKERPAPQRAVCPRCGADVTIHKID